MWIGESRGSGSVMKSLMVLGGYKIIISIDELDF